MVARVFLMVARVFCGWPQVKQCQCFRCYRLGLHDILHAIVMRISSVKTVL